MLKPVNKIIEVSIIILVITTIALLILGWFYFGNTRHNVVNQLNRGEFKELHEKVLRAESIRNLAVLPRNYIVIINDTVVDLKHLTYGGLPEIGFYDEYYKSAKAKQYKSLNDLLAQENIGFSEADLNYCIERMKRLGISDITISRKSSVEIIYSWNVSAMWGSNGILYAPKGINSYSILKRGRSKDSTHIEKLDHQNFYYFTQQ